MVVREVLAVVVRAALQWALASLLLANGAAFCLIAAAASWLRLGPPCLLCARVHRLLGSSSPSAAGSSEEEHDALRWLLCDAHAHAQAAAASSSARSEQEQMPQETCSASDHADRGTEDDSEKPEGLEAHRVVSIGSEICEQDHDDGNEQPRFTGLSNVARTSSIDSSDPYVSLFELAPIADALPEENPDHVRQELDDEVPELHVVSMSGEERPTVGSLAAALRAQRKELEAVRAELEAERRARAAAVECQRELEEQGEFDREAVRLAMQLVHETETEKHGLQRQLDASRVKSQLYEASMDATFPLGVQPGRRVGEGDDDETKGLLEDGGREASWNNNYQSLMDFMPGSVYSSSPDLANLLKLYTGGNDARRQRDTDVTKAPAVAVVTEEEEEEEEEEEDGVVAVTAAAVSDSNGGENIHGETTASIASGSVPGSSSSNYYIEAASW